MRVGPDGGSPAAQPLRVGTLEQFYALVDCFQTNSGNVFNIGVDLTSARPGGDPFGNGHADSAYAATYEKIQSALSSLSNGLSTFGQLVNRAGMDYHHVDSFEGAHLT